MKRYILLALVMFVGCVKVDRTPNIGSCMFVDKESGLAFYRCESKEVICYLTAASQQCWPKSAPQQPQQAPSPEQKPELKKVEKKK